MRAVSPATRPGKMRLDYEVRRPTRRCAAGARDLAPGEPFVSVLIDQGAEVQRLDIAASAWDGPPAEALGWWRARMPEDNQPQAAPREVMLGLLDRWADDPAEGAARYVLALLLVRRRVLRVEEAGFAEGLAGKPQDTGPETLRLSCPDRDEPFEVRVVTPTPPQAAEIEARLAGLLGLSPEPKKAA